MEEFEIPSELKEALTSKKGFSLLIKGAPGTGKTLLTLEILKKFGNSSGVYLSSRVSPSSLYEQFPWLEKCIPPLNIIDATKLYVSTEVPFGIQTFPEALYGRLQRIEKPATVVIDSWDAVISQADEDKKVALEAAIAELARHTKINLILVSENMETTSLDYMVDGIVLLRDFYIDYRKIREIELKKLRGVRINRPKYPFTLQGGRFRSFDEFGFKIVKKPRIRTIPPSEAYIATGIEELDNILGGGYKRGSFVVIEAGNDISLWGCLSIFAISVVNAISQGIYVTHFPLTVRDERHIKKYVLPFIDEESYAKYFTAFKLSKSDKEKANRGGEVVPLMGESAEEDLSIALRYASELKFPLLTFMSAGAIEHVYRLREIQKQNEAMKKMLEFAQQTRGLGNVTVVRTTPNHEITPHLIYMSSAYFKLTTIDKTVIFYGIRPETGLYCLHTKVVDNVVSLKLTPYV